MTAPASAIVLAGGRSVRFGGAKLDALVGGRPLLHRAIDAAAATCSEVIVVLAADAAEPSLPAEWSVPLRFARDAVDGQGPLAGLAAGLAEARQPLALVVGGDQPTLEPALLVELLRLVAPGSGPALDAVALEDAGQLRPLPCALRVAVARPAAAAALEAGTRSLVGLLGRVRTGILPPERWRLLDPSGASLRDVDRPADLAGLEAPTDQDAPTDFARSDGSPA